jgi:hypothetical protein
MHQSEREITKGKAAKYEHVPQMTLSLPDEEAAQWRLDFEAEMARLEEAA